MLLRQIKYFHAVIQTGNFTEAANVCHISQSAVSQQIKALERSLGVKLLHRHNRTFSLTEAGKFFYQKTLGVVSNLKEICLETMVIDHKDYAVLRIGYLSSYAGMEFQNAVATFASMHPDVRLSIAHATHEGLYDVINTGNVDLILNDQRRVFANDYENLILAETSMSVMMPAHSPFYKHGEIRIQDLKTQTCILVAPHNHEASEIAYYRDMIGIESSFRFVSSLQEGRLLVSAGVGYMPFDGIVGHASLDSTIRIAPLIKRQKTIKRTYCAFWKIGSPAPYVYEFAMILKKQFS